MKTIIPHCPNILKYSWWWWFFDQNIMISLQNVCCCCWKQTRRRFRWNIAFHVNNHLVCITLPPLLSCHLNCCYRMIKSFVLSFIHSHESENNKNFRRQYFSSIHLILDSMYVLYTIINLRSHICLFTILPDCCCSIRMMLIGDYNNHKRKKKIKKNKWIKK